MIKKTILFSLLLLFAGGCADKLGPQEVYNKPASYWYSEIIKNVRSGNLDKADDAFTSLSSEHVASPLLKEALMILAQAHSEKEEYLMANFYIDRYTTRFAQSYNIEYLKYLKIKSSFQAFKRANRDQKLLLDTIEACNGYIEKFPHSIYNPMVETMLTRLHLAEYLLNQEIIALYKRTGKMKAAKIYEERVKNSWISKANLKISDRGIFHKIF
ncbi:MAG: outer membrane protein assembly factor BamD [Campylobacteraceae bacterium 4484_4]|nr:MAG: outer membrane protein assembly factor BamD [Campylobacteraceae bacterium 4484_4]